jgi:glycosyltransferase involved in cell wall biosynthesis
VEEFGLDLLISENALTIPLNLPLALALTEYIMETGFPAIAHHHDFFWERKRFLRNACWDYLNMAFPPHIPFVQHAVINSSQDNQLSVRTGISGVVIPNVMDYANPPPPADDYGDDLREALGIEPKQKLILQPTRVVQRKGIEHAIELVHRLGIPARLVISHSQGDEGDEYARRVRDYSRLLGVEPVFCSDIVGTARGRLPDGRKIYTLEDLYRQADLVTYPSILEGFGNAFLESVYYRRPLVVNDYAIYDSDIDPKGFETIKMTDYVTDETVRRAREVLENPQAGRRMADRNYELARRFFSYEVASERLCAMLTSCFGIQNC